MSLLLDAKRSDEKFRGRRALKRSETRPVLPRHRFVLELHLAGHAVQRSLPGKPSICELTGYSPAMVYRILASEEIQALKQQVMRAYDQEFEALYPEVVQAIREGLADGNDMQTRLAASKLWLKAHGKLQPDNQGQVNVTAEDVVIQILNQASEARQARQKE